MITLAIGLPGSGKTRFRNNSTNMETHAREDRGYVQIVSPDVIRKEHFGVQFDKELEPKVWAIVEYKIYELAKAGYNIFVDATNVTKAGRANLLKFARKGDSNIKTKAIYFECPIDQAIKNDAERPEDQQVGEEVINRMFNMLELPTIDEFDSIIKIKNIQGGI